MKDQYAGDINDYVKYSILRRLTAATRNRAMTLCWLLTANDKRTDGNLRSYLNAPDRFREFDPDVFDAMKGVSEASRGVATVEAAGLIRGATYFSEPIQDDADQRRQYFERFWRAAHPGSLLFFDPDNGLEVRSVAKGKKNSSKYLYFDELGDALQRGHSAVVYQHFPRVARDAYVAQRLDEIRGLSTGRDLLALCSTRVAYLISAASQDQPGLVDAAQALVDRWGGSMRIVA